MLKGKKGSKQCSIGANCKSTCIEKSKDCLKESGNENIKSATAKIKGAVTKFAAQKELDKFVASPRIPTANAFLAKLMEKSDKSDGYGAEITGKNFTILQTAVKDFQAMAPIPLRLNKIEEKPGVGSSADRRNGVITIGENNSSGRSRLELFHELGHFLEKANPENEKAAKDWLTSKATGEPELLSKLTGDNRYKAETAYPGIFYDAYVGKHYMSGATEVYSKGFENFSSGAKLVDFFNKAPDHFAVIIDAIKRAK